MTGRLRGCIIKSVPTTDEVIPVFTPHHNYCLEDCDDPYKIEDETGDFPTDDFYDYGGW